MNLTRNATAAFAVSFKDRAGWSKCITHGRMGSDMFMNWYNYSELFPPPMAIIVESRDISYLFVRRGRITTHDAKVLRNSPWTYDGN